VKRKLRLEKSIVRFGEFWCGLVRIAAAGEKEKIMVPLGAVESLWVPLGAERFRCRSFRFKVQGSRCARGVNLVVTS